MSNTAGAMNKALLDVVRLRMAIVPLHAVNRGWDRPIAKLDAFELPPLKVWRPRGTPVEMALCRWLCCPIGPRPSPESQLSMWDRATPGILRRQRSLLPNERR